MLFHSSIYMFLFMPLVCGVFYILRSQKHRMVWLVIASLAFYAWWNIAYLPLLLGSIVVNYYFACTLLKHKQKLSLASGIAFNLILLGYFKYAAFIVRDMFGISISSDGGLSNIILPLAISFFTFQQIAYLVDCYKNKVSEHSFLKYILFVSFFPQLIAGPIVHHSEMMPQFEDKNQKNLDSNHIIAGLLLFTLGFFKKVVLADTYALWVSGGFENPETLGFVDAWSSALSYSFQIYFDFSGYVDMALGSALMLNIKLPFNFNSPYRALSIRDFWRRWHITLSRFLRDYLYIPLGGNRRGELIAMRNVFITFLLGGLWHGASWTFVIWGAFHGSGIMISILVSKFIKLPMALCWAITFIFVTLGWVLFRADTVTDAGHIYIAMLDFQTLGIINILWIAAIMFGMGWIFVPRNSNTLRDMNIRHPAIWAIISGVILFSSIIILQVRQSSEFLYFQF